MKKLNKHFFVILFLFLSVPLFSQSTKLLFQEGNKLFKQEHYRKALPYLEKVLEAEPNNAEAMFEAGVCYLHRYSKEKALQFILKAYALDPKVSKYIHFWLGRAYHQNYQYDKAIEHYNIYKGSLGKADQRRKEADKHIAQTNTARQFTANPEDYRVRNLGPVVNSIYSEHSPVSSSNDSLLLFTSRRHDVTGGKEDLDGEFFEDVFQTYKQADGSWSAPVKFPLNTSGHDASIQLFDKDTKMLLYREAKGGDIYYSEKDQATQTWREPQKFANINTPDFEADAFIAPDGKSAYFATNHYKKVGDLDIYYITKKEDGTWGRPQELPGRINTSEDEDAPFISPDGKTLYFSSRGHKNMGGFDIFKSTLDNSGNWSQPVNLGYPINTPDDDAYYYMLSSGKKAYVSSYREGGYGEKDLYEISPIPKVLFVSKFNFCQGKSEGYNISIKSLLKTTRPVSVGGKIQDNQYTSTLTSFNTYRIAVFNARDTIYAENFEIPFMEEDNKKITKVINIGCPEGYKDTVIVKDTVLVAPLTLADSALLNSLKYVFRDIYFNKGTLDLTEEGKRELAIASEILKKNPTAEVTVKGYTSREEKRTLAGRRAHVIMEELKRSGVVNINIDPQSETNGVGSTSRAASLDVKLRDDFKTGFDPALIPPSSVGPSFVLRTLFFESASSELREVAQMELNLLVDVMNEFKDIHIEIAGHTDSRGPDSLNLILSEKRASTAAEYVKSKGISAERVKAKGYGETQPVSDNNTDKGRELNRRTELRVSRGFKD